MSASDSTLEQRAPLDTKQTPEGRKPGIILAFIGVAQFMVFLDVSIVNVALPSIQDSLKMPEVNLEYIITAYGTVLGGFLLLGGRLADRFGRRRMLQSGLVVFALTSLVAGLAQNDAMLIGARAVQGLGSALIAPAALSILTNTFAEGPARNKALGIWGALTGMASVAGVILGGLLTQGPGWRWIFFINVPIGLVAAAIAPTIVREGRGKSRETFDTAGAVALTASLLLLIFTLGEAVYVGWTTFRTIGSLAGVVVLFVAFLVIESRAASPLIPLSIFRLRALRTANVATVLLFGTTVTLFFFASLFMQQVYGYSPTRAGLAYVPLAIVVSVGAGLASNLVTKVAAKPVLLIGLSLTSVGLFLLWRAPAYGSYAVDLLPAFLIVGLGLGMSFVTLQITAFVGVGKEESGLAAGLINTSQEAGGALGVAIAATIAFSKIAPLKAAAHGDPVLLRYGRAEVFHQAFLVGIFFSVGALLLAVALLPWARPSDRPDTLPVA
ncbi:MULTISPECIES: MFS transporter [Streptomyces]|uniref:MFS transporter n=1 Tax=Streptomyces TaxID=1883 RepID=UPI000A3A7BA8|nr:MFS transporter [Streptomyces sp. NRRL B-24572]